MCLKRKKYACTIHLMCVGFFGFCKQTEIINKIYFWLYTQLKITGIHYKLTRLKVILLTR